MKFTPFGSGVAVQPDATPGMAGSIAKPESVMARDRQSSGIIVALGPDAPSWLKIGQRVLYAPYAGTTLKVEKRTIYSMNPSEILGTVSDA